MEPLTQRPGEASPPTQRLGEAEPVHLGVDWSYSRALDCSDESVLMTISSSSSGTLVLVPDSSPRAPWRFEWNRLSDLSTCQRVRVSTPGGCSPRAYGGVEYSFGGFFEREDSAGLGFLLPPMACPGDGDSLFTEVVPFAGVVVSFDGCLAG